MSPGTTGSKLLPILFARIVLSWGAVYETLHTLSLCRWLALGLPN